MLNRKYTLMSVGVHIDNTERETENKKAFDIFKKQQGSGSKAHIDSNPTERDGMNQHHYIAMSHFIIYVM